MKNWKKRTDSFNIKNCCQFSSLKICGRVLIFGILMALILSCNSNESGVIKNAKITLNIATAANAQFALKEIEEVYESLQDSIKLEIVVSSSGKLTAQIQQGAPYDVFLSANMKYPDYLFRENLASSTPKVYAQGGLVIWSSKLLLDNQNWRDHFNQVAKIAIANPEMAPYGEQAIQFFNYYDLYSNLKNKLVYGESISQTNQYILSGACELGITAKSVVLSPPIKDKGSWTEVPTESYKPIEQGLVITHFGQEKHPEQSKAFVDFLFSAQAKAILEKYGYIVPY